MFFLTYKGQTSTHNTGNCLFEINRELLYYIYGIMTSELLVIITQLC